MIDYLGLDHVVLRCRDIELMRRFYGETLGMVEERVLADLGLYQYRAGSSLIDLADVERPVGQLGAADSPPDPASPNMAHLCLRIGDADLAPIAARLSAQGIDVDAEPGRRYGADGFGLSIYLRDPEGNVVELKTTPEPNSRL
ncbi:MAG: VOC family protein [Alphaproteobacteria bacterium]|nr:VOC family protein [Alphaproteobacteria bacterium]